MHSEANVKIPTSFIKFSISPVLSKDHFGTPATSQQRGVSAVQTSQSK